MNLLSSRIPDNQWTELVNSKAKPLVNKGIAGLYPPGSTFKSGNGNGNTGIWNFSLCSVNSTGQYRYGKLIFRIRINLERNYQFCKIHRAISKYILLCIFTKTGINNIVKYAKEFGIGSKTGIDIPGELTGTLPSPEWKKKDLRRNRIRDGCLEI